MSTNNTYLKALHGAEEAAVEAVHKSRADLAAADEMLTEAKAERAAATEAIEEIEASWSTLDHGDPDPAELVAAQAALRRADLRLTAAKRQREDAQRNLVGTDAAGARAVADWLQEVLGDSITVAATWLSDPPAPTTAAQLPALVVSQTAPTVMGQRRDAGYAAATVELAYHFDPSVHHDLGALKTAIRDAAANASFGLKLGNVSGRRPGRARRVGVGNGRVEITETKAPKIGTVARETLRLDATGLVLSQVAPFAADGPSALRIADKLAADIAAALVEPYAREELAFNPHARPDRVQQMPIGRGLLRYDAEKVETAAASAVLADPDDWTRRADGTISATVTGSVAAVFYSEPISGTWHELIDSAVSGLVGEVVGGAAVRSIEHASPTSAPWERGTSTVSEALRGDGVTSPRWSRPRGGYEALIEFTAQVEWRDAPPMLEEVAA